jgi:cobalt-zinc-cadmium resistance protein CzcA
MIERIIHFSIKNKVFIGLFTFGLVAWGIYSLINLPIDAVPDITNNQVQIISRAPSLAVQEVESFITTPVEVSVANIPDVIELRSISRLGLSVVTVVFKENINIYWARQQISEKLREAEEQIPEGLAKIEMAPVSTGLGEIFSYTLEIQQGYESKYSPMDLRTCQDWIVRRQMLGTPGVAEVNSYGGFVKQYEIAVHPEKLSSMGLSLNDIFEALENNNENTGSAYIDKKPAAYFIRGIGLVKTIDDIENIAIKSIDGIPVLVRDIATVQYGSAIRYGALVSDDKEAVGGVVMMLKGGNAKEVNENVRKKITSIQKSLPVGIEIRPYLDRSDLVSRAIGTVTNNLIEGALIVLFILVLLLGNLRAGLVVASVIPLAMLFAVSMMHLFGISGNLMSLGAIDFGLIVDGAVIIVESVVHRISLSKHNHQGIEKLSQQQMDENVFDSAKRMMNSATFGQIIILIVYLPILALVGIEGKMFRPMGQVVSFAILGAIILSLTWVPMLSSLFLSKNTTHKPNISDKIMELIHRAFDPVIAFALRKKKMIVFISVVLFIGSIFLFTRLGGEFIPQLEEGDLAGLVITMQGGSPSHTVEVAQQANKILKDNFPEINHLICKIGPGEIPTDPTPMETGDYIITLKDKKEWTSAKTREELVEKMEEKLGVLAGVKFEFSQPIQLRFNELMTGSRQDVAIKLYGDNLDTLAFKALEIENLIENTEGVVDINTEKVTGLAQIQIEYDRQRMAQYDISVTDINKILKTAFAGTSAGVVFDEEKRFDMVVRLAKEYRTDIEDVKNLNIALPDGRLIPLEQVANVEFRTGPAQVSRENTKRRLTIGFNVRGRDIQSVVNDVQSIINSKLVLPVGYYTTFGGQFENLISARKRLAIAVPVALLLIFVLLYFTFNSLKQTILIYTAVPMAAIGGVVALWFRDMNFSISAGVGFIALFGVAVLNGIVLIAEFNRLEKEGITDISERVLKGLRTRLRPVILTAAVASLGFLPMALSKTAGAEVQKPLATVVIGGLITSTLLTLVVLPVLYILFTRQSFKKKRIRKKLTGGIAVLFFAIILPTCRLNAQSNRIIGIEEAIHLALDSNLAMKSSVYSLEMKKALRGSSWDIPKTSIEGQYGQFNSFLKDNSIAVSQSLEFPTVYINRYKLSNANISSSEWELKSTQVKIASEVKQLYWQLVYQLEKQKLQEYQDSLFTGFSRAAELRSKAGETNRLEMFIARSQSLEVKNQLNQTKADAEIFILKLQTLLNVNYCVVPTDTELRRINHSEIIDSLSLADNPSLGFVKQQVEVARIEKKVERSQLMPDLSIGYFSQTMQGVQEINGIPQAFGQNDRLTGIQAGIAIPLWAAPQIYKLKAARLNEMIVSTNSEYFYKSLYGEYKSLLNELTKFNNSIDYYETQAIPEAEMILEQASRSYKAGAIDYLDYILAIDRALSIKQSFLDALNGYNQSIISIEFITGKIY